ncbi:TetR/AcrR family transcriptional regulator [Novosphingopyxis sp.]|uniref:TetR/AcrR family transcriptional regulator n=1 Tax=Novosphingopyxis sp. TaxID=2709690 RepID=UPI003B591EB5
MSSRHVATKKSVDHEASRQSEAKPRARSVKSARKREQIVRAATEIINRKSYALSTMTEIAAALDLRDGSLYYYYPSKQALAYACHVASLERIERLLVNAQKLDMTGAERLRHYIRHMIEDAERHGSQLYVGDYSYLEEDQHDRVVEWSKRLEKMIEQFLVDGVKDGSIVRCDTQLVAQLIIGMLIWLAKWTPTIEHMTVDRLMDAISIASLNGLETS